MSIKAYASALSTKATPQSEPIPGADQVPNNAGGYGFAVDKWVQLERFLILGSEGGTYYVKERKLTQDNAKATLECIQEDGPRAINIIRDISVAGRAPKNDPAIFALALAAAFGNNEAKSAAYAAVNDVCRIGTHLFQFAEVSNELRGWGRGLRTAIANWYLTKTPNDLAYQVSKYQQREGWSHRDLLRLSHPKAEGDLQVVLNWCVKGWPGVGDLPHPNRAFWPIWAMESAKKATSEEQVVRLIRDYRLVRECIPTQWLNSAAVWDALLGHMPMTAMLRNLGKMTAVGLLKPLSHASRHVCEAFGNVEAIRKARLHPLALLNALRIYSQGRGDKGSLSWTPDQSIVNVLDAAFYTAFKAVKPTGKRWLLAVDISGSMGAAIAGMNLDCRTAAAVLSLVTANVEPHCHIVGFASTLKPLNISPRQRLDDVVKELTRQPFGNTDCSLPMFYALENKLDVDAFCVLTDSETWAGNRMHPVQALRNYREKTGIGAKLLINGMTATNISIADPKDAGNLDVVGLDTHTPSIMSEFVGYSN